MSAVWATLRRAYHRQLCQQVLALDSRGVPNNADRHSRASRAIAQNLWQIVCAKVSVTPPTRQVPGQTVGRAFETATRTYLEQAFGRLQHLRPGRWHFTVSGESHQFAQYRHLVDLKSILQAHRQLHAALGDYLIHPDIIVARYPVTDEEINREERLLGEEEIATLTPLRAANNKALLLHASVSCKWTMRSDRAQNVRTEALNLIRNRKGHTPHVVVVTAEPLPGRLASLALGTGDLDCVYHVALPELRRAVAALGEESARELLETMILGQRLRDISDLPLDLAA
ncbi:MAG TPA: restriction endonuclease [Anaerolineae bacterium]|nr:restriction endonuclease [Anaerolineae bacterium]HID84136.1 restriction endonuclease [Anaerolineales bacterium]HIQ09096.1 restriction endonuclease [Anaerolineaceae bacterium]